jgi:hypothetical protein
LGVLAAACSAPVEDGNAPGVGESKASTETLVPINPILVPVPIPPVIIPRQLPPPNWDLCAAGTYPTTNVLQLPAIDPVTGEDLSKDYGPGNGYQVYFPTPYAYLKDQVQYESLINEVSGHRSYEYLVKNVIVERNSDGTYILKGWADPTEHEYFVVGWLDSTQYYPLKSDVYSTQTPNGYASWSVEPNVQAQVISCVHMFESPSGNYQPGAILKATGEAYPFAEEHDPTKNPNGPTPPPG